MNITVTVANDAAKRISGYELPEDDEIAIAVKNRPNVIKCKHGRFCTTFSWCNDVLNVMVGQIDEREPIISIIIDAEIPPDDCNYLFILRIWVELVRATCVARDPLVIARENHYEARRSMIGRPYPYLRRLEYFGPLSHFGIIGVLDLEYEDGTLTLSRTEQRCVVSFDGEIDQSGVYDDETRKRVVLARVTGDVDEAIAKLNNMIHREVKND